MTAVELTPENFAAVEAVAQQARSDADAALGFMLGYVNGAGPWLEKLADYLDDVGHPGGRRLRRITEVAADTATKAEKAWALADAARELDHTTNPTAEGTAS